MSDGHKVPLAHDGMGVFNTADGKFRLVRNHEDRNGPGLGRPPSTPTPTTPGAAAAPRRLSSIRSARVGARLHQPERHHRQLRAAESPRGTPGSRAKRPTRGPAGWLKQHGYCFDVPASANSSVPAVAIPSWAGFRTRRSRSIPTPGSSMRPRTTAAAAAPAGSTDSCRTRRESSSTAAGCRCWPSRAASSTTRATTRRSVWRYQ